MKRSITILGCGSSGGVPRVGQGWGACDPQNEKNRRRRCSILVRQETQAGSTNVVVDISPDFRQQLLDAEIETVDAILLTHSHADHVHGIDDVRPLVLRAKRRLPVFMDAETASRVCRTFRYIFETEPGSYYPPLLDRHSIESGSPLTLEGPGGPIPALPFLVNHGEIDAIGFRFGNTAYSPDLKTMPDSSADLLSDLDLWIVDALRYAPHPSHFALRDTLSWIERVKPKRAILTNMNTELDYEELRRQLPDHVVPAFDGMVIPIG